MKTFDVLKRDQSIHCHSILEASAGTGKTFAIENMTLRLLIEEQVSENGNLKKDPLLIEKILIVTFTKAAARELKCRIRKKLESDLILLRSYKRVSDKVPDYLSAIFEKGDDAVRAAIKRINTAIINFDKAQIFTIHSFCYRMLRKYSVDAGMSFNTQVKEDGSFEEEKVFQSLQDFLRLELKMPAFSAQQLKIIAAHAKYDEERLIRSLLKEIEKGIPIGYIRSYIELLEAFQRAMESLKTKYHFNEEQLKNDLYHFAAHYKLHTMQKTLKPEYARLIDSFSELFQKNEWGPQDFDQIIAQGLITEVGFTKDNLRDRALACDLIPQNVNTLKIIEEHLAQIIEEARNPGFLFARVVSDCREFLENFQEMEEMIGHTSLLKKMRKAIDNPLFSHKIKSDFQAVIVDEFQDTDPLQWDIFSILFTDILKAKEDVWEGYLTLVGDPKQSIYAFRQADIYTYLSAVKTLGEKSLGTLMTNFRSHPRLVDALNALFMKAKKLFELPRVSGVLEVRPVMSALPVVMTRKDLIVDEQEIGPRLEFWLVENEKASIKELELEYFFPKIANEIVEAFERRETPLSSYAILVADRYQAKRVSLYLKEHGIAVKTYKGKSFAGSPVVSHMKELIAGVLNFESQNLFKVALAGKLIGMTHDDLEGLKSDQKLMEVLSRFENLKHIFMTQGFAPFIMKFMASRFHENGRGGSVLENLLETADHYEFYREWQDLCDFLCDEELKADLRPEALLAYLQNINHSKNLDDERFQSYVDAAIDGVSILTIHASKGLEFDHVLALGLINRQADSEGSLIPVYNEEGVPTLFPSSKDHPDYLKFCEEVDAEKMRQLYVALTRAKYKLFVPFITYSKQTALSPGTASPMELLAAKLSASYGSSTKSYQELYEAIASLNSEPLKNFQQDYHDLVALKILNADLEIAADPNIKLLKSDLTVLVPPPVVSLKYSDSLIQSYVSITESLHQIESGIEGTPPHDFEAIDKTCHTLPTGSEIGILLHTILEAIFVQNIKFAGLVEVSEFLHPFIKETPYREWGLCIAEMVFNALNVKIETLHNSFCLKDVPSNKIYCETEFLIPYTKELGSILKVDVKAEYIKGVIDLFFEHEGKYYLVDWKSNWLGDNLRAYSKDNLLDAMKRNHYNLQASIYLYAMERYIKIFDKGQNTKVFGGVYYIFLRGLDPHSDRGVLKFNEEFDSNFSSILNLNESLAGSLTC